MRARIYLVLFILMSFGLVSVANAQDLLPRDNGIFSYHQPPRYRESEAHPLRFAAYIVHPVGWILREGIFRPFSAMASSTEFTRSFMGYREPFDYREPDCYSADSTPDCRTIAPIAGTLKAQGEQTAADTPADASTLGERQVFIPDVNFEFDKAALNDLGKGRVRQIAQLLASVPSLNVVVSGHTDFKGSDTYNQELGMQRAQAVITELTELGIDPARMSPVSYGKSQPVFTEEEDWARAVNRRVQFSVSGAAQAQAAAPQDAGEGAQF